MWFWLLVGWRGVGVGEMDIDTVDELARPRAVLFLLLVMMLWFI